MILKPTFYYHSISDIDIAKLVSSGVQHALIDIDNTLVSWDTALPNQSALAFIEALSQNHIKVCLVSNNNQERVELFARNLNLPYIYKAKKPLPFNFRKGIQLVGGHWRSTVIIGDQIFTDVLGSKLAKIQSVLVDPIGQKEFAWTMFVRKIENFIRKNLVYTK